MKEKLGKDQHCIKQKIHESYENIYFLIKFGQITLNWIFIKNIDDCVPRRTFNFNSKQNKKKQHVANLEFKQM